MNIPEGHAEPVYLGFLHKTPGLFRIGEALSGGEKLLVRWQWSGFVAEHRSEFTFSRNARLVGHLRHSGRGGYILIERQA